MNIFSHPLPFKSILTVLLVACIFTLMSCSSNNRVDPNADPDGDGIANALDNCPSTANPEQFDSNGDGEGDTCDLLVASMGSSKSGEPPKVVARYYRKLPFRSPAIFTLYNGSQQEKSWSIRMEPKVEWLIIDANNKVAAQDLTSVRADIRPEGLEPEIPYSTRIWLSTEDGEEYFTDYVLYVAPDLSPQQCIYTVTLTRFTVMARQGLLQDGLALEPFTDLNAVGVGRLRNPLRGNHVLRAGQSVFPNALIGVGQDTKGNQINLQVIADVDEIDGGLNPDDLRQQGQSGVANFQFTCDFGTMTKVIPVPVVGNILGEGNGAVEIEITVDWDP